MLLPWIVAAPSCVLPAGIVENCTFLAPRFDEIGLAFFETEACLAYGDEDLPEILGLLPVSWHMHLPLDLPWDQGPGRVAQVVLALREKAGPLRPQQFVLHPPAEPQELAELARLLIDGGLAPGRVLVENIAGRDLERLWPAIEAADLGVCLDLGHMLAHGQEDFLDLPGIMDRTRMLHLNAPHPEEPLRHASLALLDGRGRELCQRLLSGFAPGGVVMLELFGPEALFESFELLRGLWGAQEGLA